MSRKRPQVVESESEDELDDEVDEPAAKTNKRQKTVDLAGSNNRDDKDDDNDDLEEKKVEKVVNDKVDDADDGEAETDKSDWMISPVERQEWCTGWEAEEDHYWFPYAKNDRAELKPQLFPLVHNFHADFNESRKKLWARHLERIRDSTKKLAFDQRNLRLTKYEDAIKIGLRASSEVSFASVTTQRIVNSAKEKVPSNLSQLRIWFARGRKNGPTASTRGCKILELQFPPV